MKKPGEIQNCGDLQVPISAKNEELRFRIHWRINLCSKSFSSVTKTVGKGPLRLQFTGPNHSSNCIGPSYLARETAQIQNSAISLWSLET